MHATDHRRSPRPTAILTRLAANAAWAGVAGVAGVVTYSRMLALVGDAMAAAIMTLAAATMVLAAIAPAPRRP